jgi:micrococcal nuclease
VVDGDTIDVSLGGQTQRVRLIGVDTPEVFGGTDCFGPEASAFTKTRLAPGLPVTLEKDVSETDRFGRLLRYVYMPDGIMFNELLVAEGYAQVATFPPDVKYQERFLAAQRAAREQGKGLWSGCVDDSTPGVTLTPTRTPITTPTITGLPIGTRTGKPVLYDPSGPDRDCGDFPTWAEAQDFYEAAGGPATDRHRLDGDSDGIACETLPGAQ